MACMACMACITCCVTWSRNSPNPSVGPRSQSGCCWARRGTTRYTPACWNYVRWGSPPDARRPAVPKQRGCSQGCGGATGVRMGLQPNSGAEQRDCAAAPLECYLLPHPPTAPSPSAPNAHPSPQWVSHMAPTVLCMDGVLQSCQFSAVATRSAAQKKAFLQEKPSSKVCTLYVKR